MKLRKGLKITDYTEYFTHLFLVGVQYDAFENEYHAIKRPWRNTIPEGFVLAGRCKCCENGEAVLHVLPRDPKKDLLECSHDACEFAHDICSQANLNLEIL